MKTKRENRIRRHARIRAKVKGTDARPRLAVFKSNAHIYAQLINDDKGVTLAAANDMEIKGKTKTIRAQEVGKLIAKLGKEKKVTAVVFDRGGYIYTGRVRALADAAREGGLQF